MFLHNIMNIDIFYLPPIEMIASIYTIIKVNNTSHVHCFIYLEHNCEYITWMGIYIYKSILASCTSCLFNITVSQ